MTASVYDIPKGSEHVYPSMWSYNLHTKKPTILIYNLLSRKIFPLLTHLFPTVTNYCSLAQSSHPCSSWASSLTLGPLWTAGVPVTGRQLLFSHLRYVSDCQSMNQWVFPKVFGVLYSHSRRKFPEKFWWQWGISSQMKRVFANK